MKRALVVIVLAGVAPAAQAFTAFANPSGGADSARWAGPTVPIQVLQGGVDDVTDGTDQAAMEAAVATWNAALGSSLQLQTSTTTSRGYGEDGVNRLIFLESSWPSAADGALGTTLPNINGGVITDADVLLNGTLGPWVTDGNPLGIDVQSVATHELGHLLGLWHANPVGATMYTGTRRGSTFRARLSPDDERGARWQASAGQSCVTDEHCPLLVGKLGGSTRRLACNNGTCAAGPVGYGLDCTAPGHCSSGLCLDDRWSGDTDDPGACTRSCNPAANDCPGGDACVDTGSGGVCVPGRGCNVDADCGGGNNDKCILAFDGEYRCTHLCARDSNCMAPQRCTDLGYGAGVCTAPGALPAGSSCLHALECTTLSCRGAGDSRACESTDGGVPGSSSSAGGPSSTSSSSSSTGGGASASSTTGGTATSSTSGGGDSSGSSGGDGGGTGCACAASTRDAPVMVTWALAFAWVVMRQRTQRTR